MTSYKRNSHVLGKQIRELREGKELLQRQLAASLEINTPLDSKRNVEYEKQRESRFLSQPTY